MNRVDYKTLKQWFLDDAYIWCQRKFYNGVVHKWDPNESDEWGGHYIALMAVLILI